MWSTTRSSAEPQRCGSASPRTCQCPTRCFPKTRSQAIRTPHPVITWTFAGPLDFAASFDFRRSEDDDGRVTGWMKMEKPFVGGESNDPRVLIAAVADMIPSGGSVLDYERMISINADLIISLHRPPEGEWLGFTAAVRGEGNGYGQADATLFDHRGRVGRALKSLLIDTR